MAWVPSVDALSEMISSKPPKDWARIDSSVSRKKASPLYTGTPTLSLGLDFAAAIVLACLLSAASIDRDRHRRAGRDSTADRDARDLGRPRRLRDRRSGPRGRRRYGPRRCAAIGAGNRFTDT